MKQFIYNTVMFIHKVLNFFFAKIIKDVYTDRFVFEHKLLMGEYKEKAIAYTNERFKGQKRITSMTNLIEETVIEIQKIYLDVRDALDNKYRYALSYLNTEELKKLNEVLLEDVEFSNITIQEHIQECIIETSKMSGSIFEHLLSMTDDSIDEDTEDTDSSSEDEKEDTEDDLTMQAMMSLAKKVMIDEA